MALLRAPTGQENQRQIAIESVLAMHVDLAQIND